MFPKKLAAWGFAFLMGGLAVVLISCSSLSRTAVLPPAIEGATFVGNRACYDCHTNHSRVFASSAHARVHPDGFSRMPDQAGCESCHGPGSRHIAVGGGRGRFILNPGKDPKACLTCHIQTHAEFNLPQHHPVLEGRLSCVDCHDPHGRDIMKPAGLGLGMSRLNETCAQCHREQSRQHVYEHQALWEGCTACHTPHGSVNAKLLTQRDNNLCLRCHAQVAGTGGRPIIGKVDHSQFVNRGTCWSAGCHPAVHGSNISPYYQY